MATREHPAPYRPPTIHFGCGGISAFSAYGILELVPIFDEPSELKPLTILLPVLLGSGIVFALLAWLGFSWSRLLILVWVLFPAMSLIMVEGNITFLVSPLFLAQAVLVATLYSPPSNTWYRDRAVVAT